ncbi:MAG: hypothetical protein BWY70_01102 [Bacteroidetes bacterium ADurb.Bin408]|nr:MAG: hypothetical protein BWY70_01102 [Bacteroidetes bacterium ADurb.Bin408]
MNRIFLFAAILGCFSISNAQQKDNILYRTITKDDVKTGAECTAQYFPMLKGKRIAICCNQTSMIGKAHLVDSLIKAGFDVKKVFAPEHGFRGDAEAGAIIGNYTDKQTGLPVISLYGKDYKPKASDLNDVDVVIFDIQDVGARFYTYISTMHYVMEACAENKKTCLVLDRPNPNGFYVDGPVLEKELKSFIGMHPVPIVHGMTIAEYAQMINGEGWLKNGIKCDLKFVKVDNYNHTYFYILPVKPSPNLPNMNAVYLYPSLCLFEGTVMSIGRGTDKPFQVIGHPDFKIGTYTFTPESRPEAKEPPCMGKKCKGYDLTDFAELFIKNYKQIYLFWLMGAYENMPNKDKFFNSTFDKLAGTALLKKQIIEGVKEEDIKKSWQPALDNFKKIRKKYLLYTDFE